MFLGKTTLLKSKAVSLAGSGQTVSYVIMGGGENTESVMSIATRLDLAQYHPAVEVVTQQDLRKFYRSFHPYWWSRWPITPSPLSLLKFYIDKEKSQNVMVDELPLHESNWRHLLFKRLSVLFSSYSLLMFLGPCFPIQGSLFVMISVVFITSHHTLTGPIWMLAATIGLLLIFLLFGLSIRLIISHLIVKPFNLGTTASLLRSLPPLLASSSSSLWLALNSRPFTDVNHNSFRRGAASLQKDLEKWKNGLQSCFSVPTLKHNEVADTKEFTELNLLTNLIPMTDRRAPLNALHAPPPRAPPSLPPTPSFRPIYLPVYSTSQTMEALKHAYNRMGRPTTLVLLLDTKDQFREAKDTLSKEGLSVVTYKDSDDAENCKSFLQNQMGVLVTTPMLFSGMEAANVIWVNSGRDRDLTRGSKLRAIQKLCVIDTYNNNSIPDPTIENGFEVDGKFDRCAWSCEEKLLRCNSHLPTVLCLSCAAVCHPSCEVKNHSTILHTVFGFLFPYNPCSCSASGRCQLERASWLSRISTGNCVVVSLAIFVIIWAATGSFELSSFVLVCMEFLFFLVIPMIKLCLPSKQCRSQQFLPSASV